MLTKSKREIPLEINCIAFEDVTPERLKELGVRLDEIAAGKYKEGKVIEKSVVTEK